MSVIGLLTSITCATPVPSAWACLCLEPSKHEDAVITCQALDEYFIGRPEVVEGTRRYRDVMQSISHDVVEIDVAQVRTQTLLVPICY